MLYIISFQSISCREVSPTSPRPHAAPPEGSSARAEVAGLPIGHSLNLPPGFPHVAQLGPLAGHPLNLPPGFPHVAQLCPLAGLPLNLPPGFPHVAQLCPLAGPSKQFSLGPHPSPQTSLPIGLPLNLPHGFPHVAQLCPLAGPSKQFSSRPERRSSPRSPSLQVSQCHPGVPRRTKTGL